MQPNTSALFVLVTRAIPDNVIAEISKYGGTVLQSSLPREVEEQLNATLQAGQTSKERQAP